MRNPAYHKSNSNGELDLLSITSMAVRLGSSLATLELGYVLKMSSCLEVTVPIASYLLYYPIFVAVLVSPCGDFSKERER